MFGVWDVRCGVRCVTLKKPVRRFKKPPCVRSKRLRVCRQHIRMCLNMRTGFVKRNACRVITRTRRSPKITCKPYPLKVWERKLRTTRARFPESVAIPEEICSASAILKETLEENPRENQLLNGSIHLSLLCGSKLHGLHVRIARSLHQSSF